MAFVLHMSEVPSNAVWAASTLMQNGWKMFLELMYIR